MAEMPISVIYVSDYKNYQVYKKSQVYYHLYIFK